MSSRQSGQKRRKDAKAEFDCVTNHHNDRRYLTLHTTPANSSESCGARISEAINTAQ